MPLVSPKHNGIIEHCLLSQLAKYAFTCIEKKKTTNDANSEVNKGKPKAAAR